MRFTTAMTAATTPKAMIVISTQDVGETCMASFDSYWNVTLTASVRLFALPMSRYHAWKFHVSPGTTACGEFTGIEVRSTCKLKLGPWPTLA